MSIYTIKKNEAEKIFKNISNINLKLEKKLAQR
jgi:hypothetical protein